MDLKYFTIENGHRSCELCHDATFRANRVDLCISHLLTEHNVKPKIKEPHVIEISSDDDGRVKSDNPPDN